MVQSNSSYISQAKKLKRDDPKLYAQVQRGEINLPEAQRQVRSDNETKRWNKQQKKRKEEEKKRNAERPTPEEAKALARKSGDGVWANDGSYYDGLTDDEREERRREQNRRCRIGNNARRILEFLSTLPDLDDEFAWEDILEAIRHEAITSTWHWENAGLQYPLDVTDHIAFLEKLRDSDWPEMPQREEEPEEEGEETGPISAVNGSMAATKNAPEQVRQTKTQRRDLDESR